MTSRSARPAARPGRAQTGPRTTTGGAGAFPKTNISYAPGAEPKEISEFDVEQRLDGMSGADNLNWRTSVVDLMKLVGIDPELREPQGIGDRVGRP